jgi:hypothetical protein
MSNHLIQEPSMDDQLLAEDARVVRITFTDGKTRVYAYEPIQSDIGNFAAKVDKIIESKNLILEFEDRVMFIPFTSILYYEIAPKSDMKIQNAIRVLHEFE